MSTPHIGRAAMALALITLADAAPEAIDDAGLRRMMRDGLGAIADRGVAMSGELLTGKMRKAPTSVDLELPEQVAKATSYDQLVKSVFLIGSVRKCDKCDDWHFSGAATAWSLKGDGVMVTNHHVLSDAKGDSWGVCGVDGKVYPITEVMAADPVADVAVFRVDPGGDRLTPLAMSPDAPVGTKVRVLSHPEGRYFFQTSGEVARYAKSPLRGNRLARTWMSVTADYAKGSSGGPVVDDQGRVVGMVSNTQSIYYGSRDPDAKDKQGPLQMVVKNCVPVAALRTLIKEPEVETNSKAVELSPAHPPS